MQKKSLISYAATLIMLLFFALSVVSVVLFGARTFRGIREDLDVVYYERTASSYISAKLRRADTAGSVYFTEFNDGPAIGICERIDGEPYVTYIYVYDGYLTELFCPEGVLLPGAAGEKVVPLDSMEITVSEGNVSYSCSFAGRMKSSFITLRSF